MLGLPSTAERKTCWQLAEVAGHARPSPMHHVVMHLSWSCDAQVISLIEKLATEHDLILLDPQSEGVYLPGSNHHH